MNFELVARFLAGLGMSGLGMAVVICILLLLKRWQLFSPLSYANTLLGVGLLGVVLPFCVFLLPGFSAAGLQPLWWLGLLWIGGGAAFLLVALLRKNKRETLWASWMEPLSDKKAPALCKTLGDKLAVFPPDKIMFCSVTGAPVLLKHETGKLLLLPHSNYDGQALEFTLRRVLCGLKLGEAFRTRFAFAVTLLYWWNPLCWLYYWETAAACSCAADQKAAENLPDKNAYTEFVAASMSREKIVTAAPLIPALCRKSFMRQRFRALLAPRYSAAGASAGLFVVLALVYGGGVYAISGVLAGSAALTTPPAVSLAEPISSVFETPSSALEPSSSAAASSVASSAPTSSVPEPSSSVVASSAASSAPTSSAPELSSSVAASSVPASSVASSSASEPVSSVASSAPALVLPDYPDFPDDLKEQLRSAFQNAAEASQTATDAFTELLSLPPTPEYDKAAGGFPPKELITPILEGVFQQYQEETVDTTAATPRMMSIPFEPAELPVPLDPETYFVTLRSTDAYGIVIRLGNGWDIHVWLDDVGDAVTYDLQVVAASFAESVT